MKTLKKTLCLVLAVVMAVGVLVLPAYAADPNYDPAVKALGIYGILHGYDDGKPHPEGSITRAEMAAIVYRVMTGDTSGDNKAAATKYGAAAAKFTDAGTADWAKGYIGFCANQGVLKGTPGGKVFPNEPITGAEVQAMLLRALGYDKNNEYTGPDWTKYVLAGATQTGISKNVPEDPSKVATRGAVAQLTFNAATLTDRVEPALYPSIGYYSLGKKLMEIGATAKDYDEWGAPSTIYSVTFTWPDTPLVKNPSDPDAALLDSWEPVTQAAAYAAAKLTGSTATIDVYTNGKATNNVASTTLTATDTTNTIGGQGRHTRVYADRIVIVDTFLSKVNSVTSEVKVNGLTAISAKWNATTYFNDENPTPPSPLAPTAKDLTRDVTGTTSYVKDDMIASNGVANDDAFSSITSLTLRNTVKAATATVTVAAIVYNADHTKITGFVGTNGTTYLYNYTYGYNGESSTAQLTETDINSTFVLYLDAKGNVLGVDPVKDAGSTGQGVVVDFDAGKIKAGQYYGELTVLTEKNTQVKVKFIDAVASGITLGADQQPFDSEDDAAKAAEDLVGNLVSWEPDKDSAAADTLYSGYSLVTAANNGTPVNDGDNKIEAGDADAIDTSNLVNNKTVFFVANYQMQNSKGGYVFTGYSVLTGFQSIQDYNCTGTVVVNPNGEASSNTLQVEYITGDDGWADYVLIINAVNKSTNTVEPVDNYAYLVDADAFVKVYDEYYQYTAVINGNANQPLRVNYDGVDGINATGLYAYSDLTNGSWKEVCLSDNTYAGNDYGYVDGVLYQGSTASSASNFYAVVKDASIYLVDPNTGSSTAVNVDLGTVQKAYGDAVNKIWFQLNQYGWINLIYVEIPDVGKESPASSGLTSVAITQTGTVSVGAYVKDVKFSASGTGSSFTGNVEVTATWLKLDSAGNYVPYTGAAFVAGNYRVQFTLTVKNASGQNFAVDSETTVTCTGGVTLASGTKGASVTSDLVTVS